MKRAAHPNTGLFPSRATFDGTPVENWDTFDSESFRAQINIVLDRIWFAKDPWETVNLYGKPEAAEQTATLKARLEELREETGDR